MYLSLSLVVKKIGHQRIVGKVTGKKVDCLVCPVRLAMTLLNSPIRRTETFTTQIIFDFIVNKYQTDKYFPTTF